MSAFDAQVIPLAMNLSVPNSEEAQERPYVELAITLGMILPLSPQGVPVPVGTIRMPLAKDLGSQLAEKLAEEVAKLPDPKPQIDIATSLNPEALDKLQELEGSIRG